MLANGRIRPDCVSTALPQVFLPQVLVPQVLVSHVLPSPVLLPCPAVALVRATHHATAALNPKNPPGIHLTANIVFCIICI